MSAEPFAERARFDARDMVRGLTRYTADIPMPGLLHAMIVPATIAKGRVSRLHVEVALNVPGVVRVLTADDFPAVPAAGPVPLPPSIELGIAYRGQPIALVVASTLEAAIDGAEAVRAEYETEPFVAVVDSPGAIRQDAEPTVAGDALGALAALPLVIEGLYESPTQHHNPMELLATTAVWSGGQLTIYECAQGATLAKIIVAGALQLDPAVVHVKSAFVGGAFGQKGAPQRHTVIVAKAAMLTGQPVKLVVPRGQIFHQAIYRPSSQHRVRLGADADGRLTAAVHEATQENTPLRIFPVTDYHVGVSCLYGIDHYLGTGADIFVDRQTPGFMRGTHAHPSCFAFESAVDELAYELRRDPLEFRLANDASRDLLTGNPFSSRFLRECLVEGARRFGWDRRSPEPGSMRLDDGTLVGWGVASGIFPSGMAAANVTLRIGADGTTRFVGGGHEMGQGMRTAIASTILQGLDIDPDGLEIIIGDTTVGVQSSTAGQRGTASVVPAALKAVEAMRAALAELVAGRDVKGNVHLQLARLKRPYLQIAATELAPGQGPEAAQVPVLIGYAFAGPEYPQFTTMSHIAHFVEIHIDPRTRRVRMPRAVSVADCGRVISPRTALSQMHGGVVWGFSHALRERTEVDPRYAGYLNDDLADYVIAVNADIGDVDVALLDQPDPLANAAGLKGLGELVMTGACAAIANAVFHATGKRLRSIPIRIEDLL